MSDDVNHEADAGSGALTMPNPEPADVSAPTIVGSYDPATTTAAEESIGDDVLDVDGATRLLRIGRNTVYGLVARNAIPHRRVGKQIRFNRAAVMQWLASWSPQGAKKRR